MNILSIDTTGKFCSVAILSNSGKTELLHSSKPLSHSEELAVNVKKY